MNIVGLLLAGGQSRRMGGGDKALRLLGGRSLLERVIERLRPQVAALVLNANGDPTRFEAFGLPVVADSISDFAGPLAGILAGLDWAAEHRPDCRVVASVGAYTVRRTPKGACHATAPPAHSGRQIAATELRCVSSPLSPFRSGELA